MLVPGQDVERYVQAIRRPGALTAEINYYRAALRPPPPHGLRFPCVTMPVLVIWGDRDRVLSAKLAEPSPLLVPNARVEHLREASHWVQADQPQAVNELLPEFASG